MPSIIGPLTSSQSKAVFPIAEENRVVAFSPTSFATGLSALGEFIFRVSLTSDALIPHLVRVTHAELGYQRAAIIYDETDLISQTGDQAFRNALGENGVAIVRREAYRPGETDLAAHLSRIKESDPQAIFIATLPTDMPGIMIHGRELGIHSSVRYIVAQVSNDEVETAGRSVIHLKLDEHDFYAKESSLHPELSREVRARTERVGGAILCDALYSG